MMTDLAPLNAAELAEVRALRDAASKARIGKWHNAGGDVRDKHDHNVVEVCNDIPWKRGDEQWTPKERESGRKKLSAAEVIAVGDYIAALHNTFPRLLKTIEALKATAGAAPHDPNCRSIWRDVNSSACDCWKSKVGQ